MLELLDHGRTGNGSGWTAELEVGINSAAEMQIRPPAPVIQLVFCTELLRRVEQSRQDTPHLNTRNASSAIGALSKATVKYSFD
jgi:hypothetical protein